MTKDERNAVIDECVVALQIGAKVPEIKCNTPLAHEWDLALVEAIRAVRALKVN